MNIIFKHVWVEFPKSMLFMILFSEGQIIFHADYFSCIIFHNSLDVLNVYFMSEWQPILIKYISWHSFNISVISNQLVKC